MPPALDVQTFHPVTGTEWRWVDAPPATVVEVGATLSESMSLLTVSDRDEVWRVSRQLLDVAPFVGARWGPLVASLDAPLRAEWRGEVGVGDPRASLRVVSEEWGVLRASVTAPMGTMGWPYSWNEWRAGVSVSQTHGRIGAMLATDTGPSGWGLHGALGVAVADYRVEAAASRTWTETPITSVEATASRTLRGHRTFISPFVSVGIVRGVGSPSARLGFDLRRAPPVPAPPTPAPLPVAPVAEPEPTIAVPLPPEPPQAEPPPEPPAPFVPPPAPEPPPPAVVVAAPAITRIRLDVHPACENPKPLDAQIARVRDYLGTQGFGPGQIEVVQSSCASPARVDATVIE
jgi:hypothetical protein